MTLRHLARKPVLAVAAAAVLAAGGLLVTGLNWTVIGYGGGEQPGIEPSRHGLQHLLKAQDKLDGPHFKLDGDPRLTPIGTE